MAGEKGRMPMLNVRLSRDNYNFVRRESGLMGMSMTGFINHVISEYMKDPVNVHENPLYHDIEPK